MSFSGEMVSIALPFFFLLLCLKYNIEIDVLSRKQNEKPKKKKKITFKQRMIWEKKKNPFLNL